MPLYNWIFGSKRTIQACQTQQTNIRYRVWKTSVYANSKPWWNRALIVTSIHVHTSASITTRWQQSDPFSHLDIGKRCPVICLQTTFPELISKLAVAVNQNRSSETARIIQSNCGILLKHHFLHLFVFYLYKNALKHCSRIKPTSCHSSSLKGAGGFSGTTGSWNTFGAIGAGLNSSQTRKNSPVASRDWRHRNRCPHIESKLTTTPSI